MNKKYHLERSIKCSSLSNFQAVLKKLGSLGYREVSAGQMNNIIGNGECYWEHDYRIIKIYSNMVIKYAITERRLYMVIKDIDFLKDE